MQIFDLLPRVIREAVARWEVYLKASDAFEFWVRYKQQGFRDEDIAKGLENNAEAVRLRMQERRLAGEE